MSALSATEVRVLSLLLERALALPANQREAWLAGLPPAQQVLVPRLRERLGQLAHDADAAAALEPAAPALPPRPPPRPVLQVGPYRLIEPLGGEARARVWRAERGEGAARKTCALRLAVPPDAAAADAAQQQALQRQVVLLPSHADILRLVDAGIDAEGRFYRVLPHVEGLGLVEHAQRRGLGEQALAALALKVARLLAHVHAEEVACGGLPLSSLRVDDEGRVLLLDWGQGCALRPDTVRADLRSLGQMLQALLSGIDPDAGQPPGRTRAVAPGPDLTHVLRRAAHAPGVPPYATVQELADDLAQVVAWRPVPGAAGTPVHLARLWLRRHRLALVAGTVVAGLLVALVTAGWQAYQRGQDRAQRSDQVALFLAEHLPGLVAGADGQTADIGTEAPRLQRALEAARLAYPGQPVLRGQVITELGRRFDALGQPEQAQSVLQEAVSLLQGTSRADEPALHAARVALAAQWLRSGRADGAARAAALARQVLQGCTAGEGCTAPRTAAQQLLVQSGAPAR